MKKFDGPARSPENQFQIGQEVLYLPEGIYSRIEGYRWLGHVGEVPRIFAYQLACGVDVPETSIVKHRRGESS